MLYSCTVTRNIAWNCAKNIVWHPPWDANIFQTCFRVFSPLRAEGSCSLLVLWVNPKIFLGARPVSRFHWGVLALEKKVLKISNSCKIGLWAWNSFQARLRQKLRWAGNQLIESHLAICSWRPAGVVRRFKMFKSDGPKIKIMHIYSHLLRRVKMNSTGNVIALERVVRPWSIHVFNYSLCRPCRDMYVYVSI